MEDIGIPFSPTMPVQPGIWLHISACLCSLCFHRMLHIFQCRFPLDFRVDSIWQGFSSGVRFFFSFPLSFQSLTEWSLLSFLILHQLQPNSSIRKCTESIHSKLLLGIPWALHVEIVVFIGNWISTCKSHRETCFRFHCHLCQVCRRPQYICLKVSIQYASQ